MAKAQAKTPEELEAAELAAFDAPITPADFTVRPKAPEQPIQSAEYHQTKQKERDLAQLIQYPGWKHFRENYLKQVHNLRTLAYENLDGKSDAEIGQITRSNHKAATLMEGELIRVEEIARTVYRKNQVTAE